MTRSRCFIVGATLACAVALPSGCNLDKPYPGKAFYAIEVPPPSAASRSAAAAMALRVEEARVAPPFDELAFHYRKRSSAFEEDYYVNFIARPSAMVTGSLITWLNATGPYATVVDASSAAGTGRTLETRVSELYGDLTEPAAPKAVVSIKFFLLDDSEVDARVLFTREYREATAIDGTDSAALVEGWANGLARIFAALSEDLRAEERPRSGT